jgi:hypothetical protein
MGQFPLSAGDMSKTPSVGLKLGIVLNFDLQWDSHPNKPILIKKYCKLKMHLIAQ